MNGQLVPGLTCFDAAHRTLIARIGKRARRRANEPSATASVRVRRLQSDQRG
jgi:hypothetical protein